MAAPTTYPAENERVPVSGYAKKEVDSLAEMYVESDETPYTSKSQLVNDALRAWFDMPPEFE